MLAVVAPFATAWAPSVSVLATGIATSAVALGLTVIFARWEGVRLADVGAALRGGSLARVGAGFAIGAAIVALQTAITAAFGHVRWVRADGVGAGTVVITLAGYLTLASREELAFHGYPLRISARVLGVWGAQIAIAAIFALEHVAGGWTWTNAILGAAIGSLLFGMASIATRGLAVPIGLHAAYNFCDWLRGGKGAGGAWTPVVPRGFEHRAHVAGLVAYVALMLVTTAAFWELERRGTWTRRASAGEPLQRYDE